MLEPAKAFNLCLVAVDITCILEHLQMRSSPPKFILILMLNITYPEKITIQPKEKINTTLKVVGSKSLSNRAFIISALAEGTSTLENTLIAEDTEVMAKALNTLGIITNAEGTTFTVQGRGGKIPAKEANLNLQLSGTSIRFLAALVALGEGTYQLDGNERMRQRPIQDLLTALADLGVKTKTIYESGCPPFVVEAKGIKGGKTSIAGDKSSQYLSALLMVSPYAKDPITIEVTGELQSKPFIDMTLKVISDFGVTIDRQGYESFNIAPAKYQPQNYQIEGDAMAAGYFWAAAAITGGRVKIDNVGSTSTQGDKRLADILGEMGCRVNWTENSCEVIAPTSGILKGGNFDLNDMPDQAQTLAVVALFADVPVRIENVWNMRIKETDRLKALNTELTKLGAQIEEGQDYIVINPLEIARAAEIDTYGDHRMAMAFALAGLRLEGITIKDPKCVAKTFPNFFDVLGQL